MADLNMQKEECSLEQRRLPTGFARSGLRLRYDPIEESFPYDGDDMLLRRWAGGEDDLIAGLTLLVEICDFTDRVDSSTPSVGAPACCLSTCVRARFEPRAVVNRTRNIDRVQN